LNLRVKDGKLMLECRLTGCRPEDIWAALGLSASGQGKGQTADALSPPCVAPKVAPPTVPAPTSERELCKETDLLARFARDVERAGLVGESRNAEIILVAAVSARLSRPLNVSVHGVSAAGKNHLIGSVAGFIPDEMKKFLSGMSPKNLMHSGENEYQHKAVFIAEYEGVRGADYAIRTMQSEQVIEWEYVDHEKDRGIVKKKNRVKGPAAFIQATTRPVLHPENETRLLFVQMDETHEQTRAINERQAREAAGEIEPPSPALYEGWHRHLRTLQPAPVVIPFATQLAKHFPDTRVSSRRDFPKLLGLVEASAFLHQHQRQRDSLGRIIAEQQDYSNAKDLFGRCYSAGPDEQERDLLKAADALSTQKGSFSVADLMGGLRWGKSKAYEVLNRAQEHGRIAPSDDMRGHFLLLQGEVDAGLDLPPDV
jgi:hypothetical protein